MNARFYAVASFFLCLLAGCGGDNTSTSSSPVADIPSNVTAPKLAAQPTMLTAGSTIGVPYWSEGSSSIGGQGAPMDGVNCLQNEDYHIHAHLAIIANGSMLAIPKNIGLSGCAYELHTHDATGIIHIETAQEKVFTLGQFFAVWGRYLTDKNTAGLTGYQTSVFVEDSGKLSKVEGDFPSIELKQHRSITIVLGPVPATIPSYTWPADL
jgi:hypothetical protein